MSQSSPTDRTDGESRRRASGKASPRPPTAVGATAPPISVGATKTATRSTSFASTNEACSSPPPSTSMAVTSIAKSRAARSVTSTRPWSLLQASTVTPRETKPATRSSGAASATATTARAAVPAPMRRAVTGSRARLSTTTRSGSLGHGVGSRTSRAGSSVSAVPMPTTTASLKLRSRCASSRAAAPVIHRARRSKAAILPSSVMAHLSVTCGRRRSIAVKNARLAARASASRQPSGDLDAGRAERRGSTAAHPRVRVGDGDHDPPDARGEDGLDARLRSAVMVAGLERDVERRPASPRTGFGQGQDLGVRFPRTPVIPLPDHGARLDHERTDDRIR